MIQTKIDLQFNEETNMKWRKITESRFNSAKRNTVSESTVPQELRNSALAAMRVLKDKAALSDSELETLIKRAKLMHRDELVKAAQDLLAYRDAAKSLTGDREDGKFVGQTDDFDESTDINESDSEDNNIQEAIDMLEMMVDKIHKTGEGIIDGTDFFNEYDCEEYEDYFKHLLSLLKKN